MRILIVEDDPDISALLATYLTREYFAVDVATTGERGSYFARVNDYDVVLLDYNLPEKNGLVVCREIREAGKTMPIVMLSVRSEIVDKIDLLNNGADDYVIKPFSLEEVKARIHAVLRRPSPIVPNSITIADLTIDPLSQKVVKNGKEIYLTRKEFSLLEYLARNRDRVVSRGMIMEHVWDMDGDPFSNTIEAHIFNLRKKITTKKHTLIHTIPGRGYSLQIKK